MEAPFPTLERLTVADRRGQQTVACDFYGSLVRSRSCFPYFMLVAFEAGSVLRAVILLLSSPIAWILYYCVSEAAGIKLLIFVTFAGLRVESIETCARAVLPRFYAEDLHGETWRVFSSFGKKRFVVTGGPRVIIEHFVKEYLGADSVIGTELEVTRGGRATGLVTPPGVLLGAHKRNALKAACDGGPAPDVGIGDQEHDYGFLAYCTVRSFARINSLFLSLSRALCIDASIARIASLSALIEEFCCRKVFWCHERERRMGSYRSRSCSMTAVW